MTEYTEQGRTLAFRVPSSMWADVKALMQERSARASVILRELLAVGLATQQREQRRAADRGHERGG